jgi:Transposase and inactivated derivatives, IS5 family
MNTTQLSFMDSIWSFSKRNKQSKAVATLAKIDSVVNWQALVNLVKVIDRSNTPKGGRKPLPFAWKVKMLFLQYAFNLSDEELEDQLIDRLSFQKFVGISFSQEIPDFSTLWYFKEALIEHKLMDRIFSSINHQLELHGLILKKGTIADATIIESGNKPLSKDKRENLEQEPGSQIDTEAQSTEKNGKKYFGYKGHIGVDVESKIIRKRKFTPANVHDSQVLEELLSGDERSVWADKAYPNDKHKRAARAIGIYYGVLDKKKRGKELSTKQQKRNRQKSSVRAAVEHPFAFMRKKLKMGFATAKTKVRNALRFDMNCIVYNVLRAAYLLKIKPI